MMLEIVSLKQNTFFIEGIEFCAPRALIGTYFCSRFSANISYKSSTQYDKSLIFLPGKKGVSIISLPTSVLCLCDLFRSFPFIPPELRSPSGTRILQ